ncbi:mitochondrial import inner membrane translocase subunit TIM44-2 isoform X2 [Rhododendron vialii]|uniref:mitochondrial import inner membrane translocase subunit TIM44-2 isoform X2 n=1 Tax=Rhododendron vialii TaxID=182163 RepID=UPI00265DEB72|nr:mitochondrial import inner membrane translocase subunit TIM44-2 isoform X2 [Rhododendron vialii]
MASRKLVRDFLLSNRFFNRQILISQQVSNSSTRLRLLQANGYLGNRQFSVFNEFSKQVKGEANRNQEFQQSVKELKEKAEELKGVTEDLKVRTKQTTEKLYKQVDGVWTEAEATAKKVSANLKEKISAATEEAKDTFRSGKQESSEFNATAAEDGAGVKSGSQAESEDNKQQQPGTSDAADTFFRKFKSSVSSVSPKVSLAFQKLKEAKPMDLAKKGYDVVKDELRGNPSKRKHLEYAVSTGERSSRTDVAVVASKQSRLSKMWEAFKEKAKKMQGHPISKRVSGYSEPMVTKGQEFVEDIRDRWETTDNPVVHKIQGATETVFGETATAVSLKEIRRRDPSFSLQDFVAEVQEVVRPVLIAYYKRDFEVLKKYCCTEVIERCKAEKKAFETQGFFFENKILHISEVEHRETKMMGNSPIIIVGFQTQQIHCVRDRHGTITEGGKDTIHTVYYLWAMQLEDVEELGEGAIFPIWRLREMQRMGLQALI